MSWDTEKIRDLIEMAFVARRPEVFRPNVAEAIFRVADALFKIAEELRLNREQLSCKCDE